MALRGGEAVEAHASRVVLLNTMATRAEDTEVVLSTCIILLSGEAVKMDGSHLVFLDTCSAVVAVGEGVLGACLALGGETVQLRHTLVVILDACAVTVVVAEVVLGTCMVLLCGEAAEAHGSPRALLNVAAQSTVLPTCVLANPVKLRRVTHSSVVGVFFSFSDSHAR